MTQHADLATPAPLAPHRAVAPVNMGGTPVPPAADPSQEEAATPQPEVREAAAAAEAPPQALVEFMLQGWARPAAALPAPIAHAACFRGRRRALSARCPGETVVVPAGHLKVRSNDTHYRFRPSSDFYYLTGNVEPDCVLVLEPKDGGGHADVLFVEPNPGKTDATFFTDRVKGALWVGPRLGVPESRARFAVDACRPLPELAACLAQAKRPARALRGVSAVVDAALPALEGDKDLATFLAEERLIKDAVEIEELRAVIASTHRGFEDVIERLPVARSEREVEGIFGLRARVEGNDVGYGTIAASGAHACVLHYRDNDGRLDPSELLLLDAGWRGARSTPPTSPGPCPSPAASPRRSGPSTRWSTRRSGRRWPR
jgi:Xaa-Pro aminopeptidase